MSVVDGSANSAEGATPAASGWRRVRGVLLSRDGRERTAVSWLFLRLLGVIYLIAFASLWPQLPGLIGARGVAPAATFLAMGRAQAGPLALWLSPTLAWGNQSDVALLGLCGAGILLSVALIVDIAPAVALIGLWICYLSLVNVGQDFLAFQWDTLLLETGFLAIFLPADCHVRPRSPFRSPPPSRLVLLLLRWLLFRLMLFSGAVKLLSNDPTWQNKTALRYHYETQPLPTLLAWYAHQLPGWYHTIETTAVLIIELFVPFTIFSRSRPIRFTGVAILVALQVLILLTGNYGFFNLLSIALCVPVLDDACLRRIIPVRWRPLVDASPAASPSAAPRGSRRQTAALAVAALIASLSAVQFGGILVPGFSDFPPVRWLAAACDGFHVFNSYGLFASMTTTRPEIVLEASQDGTTWREWPFRYKPGDVRRPPRFTGFTMPRLDWQMWFAALSGPDARPPWFDGMVHGLLAGSPDVTRLLGPNPFGAAPPRYLRATLYDYRFADPATHRATGAWWTRTRTGEYLPPTSLTDATLDGG
jgi:hypothetical protein